MMTVSAMFIKTDVRIFNVLTGDFFYSTIYTFGNNIQNYDLPFG